MVEIRFIDGTKETIEPYENETFRYYDKEYCYQVREKNGKSFAMFPREFIKSIRYINIK